MRFACARAYSDTSVFRGRYLKMMGLSLSGPGDFLALNFRSTRLTCACVIQGLNSGFDMAVVVTLVWLYSGLVFGVCVGKCFVIISSHVSFPISEYFPDESFSVVTLGWMLVVKFFLFS